MRRLAALLVLLFAAAAPGVLLAHGGVSMDNDVCLMKLGPYRSHFTGYQPERRATQEFCEDIPELGNVIMVMDFMTDELRSMPTDFRIVRDVNNIGRSAVYADLGSADDIEKATVFHKPAALYPHGTLSVSHRFPERGRFIGIVTATSPAGEKFISVFPFAVGEKSYGRYLVVFLIALLASVLLYRRATKS